MSLKEKLGMFILEKSIDGVANHLDKKARSKPVVKKESKPTTTNKKGNITPAYNYANTSNKNCFIMESDTFILRELKEYKGTDNFDDDYLGQYKFFDTDGELQYLAIEKRTRCSQSHIGRELEKTLLLDLKGEILGYAKEHRISLTLPVIESESKTCSVYLGDDKLCEIRQSRSVGKEHFSISGNNYTLQHTKNKEFVVKKGNKTIVKLTFFRTTFKDLLTPRSIVIEFANEKDEAIAMLLAMAIDFVCSY